MHITSTTLNIYITHLYSYPSYTYIVLDRIGFIFFYNSVWNMRFSALFSSKFSSSSSIKTVPYCNFPFNLKYSKVNDNLITIYKSPGNILHFILTFIPVKVRFSSIKRTYHKNHPFLLLFSSFCSSIDFDNILFNDAFSFIDF